MDNLKKEKTFGMEVLMKSHPLNLIALFQDIVLLAIYQAFEHQV